MVQSVMESGRVHGGSSLVIDQSIHLVVFFGMYGAGKDFAKQVVHDMCPSIQRVPSQTTRKPRPDDKGYLYRTEEEFDRMRERMIWEASSPAGRYGTLYSDLDDAFRREFPSTLDVKYDCLPRLHAYSEEKCVTPSALVLLVVCWDRDVVEQRLRGRNIPDTEVVRRMAEFDDQVIYAQSGLCHGMITSTNDKPVSELRRELTGYLSNPIPERRAFA